MLACYAHVRINNFYYRPIKTVTVVRLNMADGDGFLAQNSETELDPSAIDADAEDDSALAAWLL